MIRKLLGVFSVLAAGTMLLISSNCARSQQLQAITISPPAVVYGAAVLPGITQVPVKLTAYGSYIHPAATKDVSAAATWTVDIATVASVDSTGNLTAGVSCGIANVSASIFTDSGNPKGNVVVGAATITVDGPASLGCPQGGATHNLSVAVTGAANGVITSSPAGINCGSTCAAPFTSGTVVALSPAPISGHTFGGWGVGCDMITGTTCSVTLNGDRTVSATFN